MTRKKGKAEDANLRLPFEQSMDHILDIQARSLASMCVIHSSCHHFSSC